MDLTQFAIEQAIATMWNRYDEPLSLDDIADAAIMSNFSFTRTFRTHTGTTPGRFLAAIRLYKAKHLLLQTPLDVPDIAHRVGYQSLETFTHRFAHAVGTTPGHYRTRSHAGGHAPLQTGTGRIPAKAAHQITGRVQPPSMPHPLSTRTYVGLFASPVIEGRPVACDILDGTGAYRLRSVPAGTWYVRAATVDTPHPDPEPWNRRPRFLGATKEITVRADHTTVTHDIGLRSATLLDLPVLLALPELDNFGTGRERQPDPRPQPPSFAAI